MGAATGSGKAMRACVVAYKFYESDPRTRLFVSALAEHGYTVDVIALRRQGQSRYESINGVHIYRIQTRVVNERHRLSYLYRVTRFLVVAALFLAIRHLLHPYHLIQVESVPDFLVFAAALPKLLGTPIILDLYDIVPEFYASKFKADDRSCLFRALLVLERLSVAFADHVIAANDLWYERLISRTPVRGKCTTICYCPDPAIFYPRPKERRDRQFILLYPGTLGWHNGLDIAIRAFARVADSMPNSKLLIYGEGPSKPSLVKLTRDLGLSGRVAFYDMAPAPEIARVMSDCDLAVVPKRADSLFGNEAASTKILDLMAIGVPVITANTKVERYYFNDSLVKFFESGDERALASSILQLFRDADARRHLVLAGFEFIKENNWARKKQDYAHILSLVINSSRIYRRGDRYVPS